MTGDRARETLLLLERLAAAFDRMPQRATTGQWARALAALAAEVGLSRAWSKAADDDALARLDRAAWEHLIASLAAAERFATRSEGESEEIDLASFYDLLLDVARTERMRETSDEVGRVRVLSATSARALSIPYLFFVGLSERSFPSPERADRLYGEAEYERLAAAGLPLALRDETSQDEMLLFYEVVTRARRWLWLSYPGMDDKGQPLLASPYLAELEHACGQTTRRYRVEDLSPIPQDASSPTEQRILAVARAVGLDEDATGPPCPPSRNRPENVRQDHATSLMAGLQQGQETQPVFENILAGLEAMDSRGNRETFGPYEGILCGTAVRDSLAKRYGPDECWSASQLEQYGACPYQFFLGRVLRLRAVEELSLRTDYLARGQAVHDALAELHRQLNDVFQRATSPAAPEAQGEFRQAVVRRLAELDRLAREGGQPHQAALAEIDRRSMRNWLDNYLVQHASYDDLWRDLDAPLLPAHFEVSFGESTPTDDPLSSREPLALVAGDRRVLIRGRIDRIDVGRVDGSSVFGVVDYKTGRTKSAMKNRILSGEALQVALYVLAAEQLFAEKGYRPWAAGYWFVSDAGYSNKQSLAIHKRGGAGLEPTAEWQELLAATTERVAALVDGIRGGQFPVVSRDEHCTSYCDFRTVCRIGQVRALEKTWQPSADQA